MPSRSANSLTAYIKPVLVSWCKLKKSAVNIQLFKTFPYIERLPLFTQMTKQTKKVQTCRFSYNPMKVISL